MKSIVIFFIALFIVSGILRSGAQELPNIIIIYADDLGYGDLSCYNDSSAYYTPNLDRLAEEGVRFTDAHSPSTICSPSRYGLYSGQQIYRSTGGGGGAFEGPGGPSYLKPGTLTIAEMLRSVGYRTGVFGKWHVGLSWFDKNNNRLGGGFENSLLIDYEKSTPLIDGPNNRGFDESFITPNCPNTDPLYIYIENGMVPFPASKRHLSEKLPNPGGKWRWDNDEGWMALGYNFVEADLIFYEKTRGFITEHRKKSPEKPFFAVLSTQIAHAPVLPAPEFNGATDAGPRGDFVWELDVIVGRVMNLLKELEIEDNTLIIFNSDNGAETVHVDWMRQDYRHDPSGGWRGMKRDGWEGGHRVPFIVHWPGVFPEGHVSDQMINTTDIFATLASVAGYKLKDDDARDSYDMLPAMLGIQDENGSVRPYLLTQSFRGEFQIRQEKWKYLDHKGSGGNNYGEDWMKKYALPESEPDAPGQLYNLEDDPDETRNLYFSEADKRKQLQELLQQLKSSGRSAPLGREPIGIEGVKILSKQVVSVGEVKEHHNGLHGYIGYTATKPSDRSNYSYGMGFYSAVWPLIDKPVDNFQIGLAGAWVTPDNSDNTDKPLAPVGTYARDNWPKRGPTWSSVFQTIEGGLGYWAGNRFRYGSPKFSMNATPQCYDYEIGSPGWSFFYDTEALPDDRLGIAQLSNRLLIPPDALPFQGNPNGKFMGYTYMALPFTEPTKGDPPTGDQSWTCFLSTSNFKGPIAYFIPEIWSKTGKLFNYEFIYGRGLDARPGIMGGGAMEINTVPCFESKDSNGVVYSKIPQLQFPVDDKGRTLLVQDVTYYSKEALYDAFKEWRDGGPDCPGRFNEKGAWVSELTTRTPGYDQAGRKINGVEEIFETKVHENNVWGLEWLDGTANGFGNFPRYFRHEGDSLVAIPETEVPDETNLLTKEFTLAKPGEPFTSPDKGAWVNPGPVAGPFKVQLTDGSVVTYYWYRFVEQPSFQQYNWSKAKKEKLQAFVEKIHREWPIDRDYMAPPSTGELVTLDPALLVTPPKGLEVGYVPIVTHQEAAYKH